MVTFEIEKTEDTGRFWVGKLEGFPVKFDVSTGKFSAGEYDNLDLEDVLIMFKLT